MPERISENDTNTWTQSVVLLVTNHCDADSQASGDFKPEAITQIAAVSVGLFHISESVLTWQNIFICRKFMSRRSANSVIQMRKLNKFVQYTLSTVLEWEEDFQFINRKTIGTIRVINKVSYLLKLILSTIW